MKYQALIDGGEVCFRVSAGAQIRRWLVYEVPVENTAEWIRAFQYKKDAEEWIEKYDQRSKQDKDEEPWFWCILDIQPTSERFALVNTKKFVDNIAELLDDKNPIICFGSKDGSNFRNELATFQVYKDRPKGRPHHYDAVKRYLQKNYQYVDTDLPLEDDDVLATLATYMTETRPVICSHDKDMRQVPGMHYHTDTGELSEVSAVEGLRNFYKQLISGDPTDTIPGIYQITGKKNSKKYAGYIDRLDDAQEMYDYVFDLYNTSLHNKYVHPRYGTEDLDCILWEIGNLLYLRRNWTDTWEIPK